MPTRSRISLRTLFVAFTAIICGFGWLGWEASIVSKRRAIVAHLSQTYQPSVGRYGGAIVGDADEFTVRPFTVIKPSTCVWHPPIAEWSPTVVRSSFGDVRYAAVIVRNESLCPDVRRWFPEAMYVVMNRDGVQVSGKRRGLAFPPTYR